METYQQQQHKNHRCKICWKSFPSGRSLGGHMRSHMHSSAMDTDEKQRGQVGFGAGYALRENPKKTWRVSDFIREDVDSTSKQCRECGREFPSWKALFGHMRHHSEKTSPRGFEEEEEQGSWGEQKLSLVSFSDDNEPPLPPPAATVPRRKRRSKLTSPVTAATASSSSITGYEPEQEDVAISLMMLSRDVGSYWTAASAESDKNSVVLEENYFQENSGDESRRNLLKFSEFERNRAMLGENRFNVYEAKSGGRYQCTTCNKSFNSYHALGGHRASHKRIKTCCLLKTGGGGSVNASFDTQASAEEVVEHKSRIHECVICGKVFASGQALGGHKRSHHISNGGGGRGDMVQQQSMTVTMEFSEPLDLNLPAPVDEGSSNVKHWCAGQSLNL